MAICPGPQLTSGFSMHNESIPKWVKNPPNPKSHLEPQLDENRGRNILMNINSALVGASSINCLNSRGDSVLACKYSDRGFESHPRKLFKFFFFSYLLIIFFKKSENIPKMLYDILGPVKTKFQRLFLRYKTFWTFWFHSEHCAVPRFVCLFQAVNLVCTTYSVMNDSVLYYIPRLALSPTLWALPDAIDRKVTILETVFY